MATDVHLGDVSAGRRACSTTRTRAGKFHCELLPPVHQPWDLAAPLSAPTAWRHQHWEPRARQPARAPAVLAEQAAGSRWSWSWCLPTGGLGGGPGHPAQQLVGCLKIPRAHSHCPLEGTGSDFSSHTNPGTQLHPSVSKYQPQDPWALGPSSSKLAGPSPTCQQVDISPRPLQPHSHSGTQPTRQQAGTSPGAPLGPAHQF